MRSIVELLILEGAMASSVALSLDVLATANQLRAVAGETTPFTVRLRGSGARRWSALLPAHISETRDKPALTIVPGLSLVNESEVRERLARDDALAAADALAALPADHLVATSCSGAFLLAHAGVLDGHVATTSWWLAPLFQAMYPQITLDSKALLVRDGRITTAGAALAQMDLMLAIVGDIAGHATAARCARYLLLDERRSQSRYMALSFLVASDDAVARANSWARANLHRSFAMEELSAAAGLAPRTFARRMQNATGLSPIRFTQRLRVEAAVDLIETTKLPFEAIAERVGYADPSTLRRLILEQTGARPSWLRERQSA